jgi:uncharacterized membrane protein YjjB (DUF3815 family)
MTEWWIILSKAFWCGWAALGFGILFNTPNRALVPIWIGGFVAGIVKFTLFQTGINTGIIFSSFAAAVAVGITSIPIAHWRHVPPLVFTIPSLIPLVPGVYAYRTMLGLIKLTGAIGPEYSNIISETVRHGVLTLFIVMAIAMGVVTPMIILGTDSVKNISLKNIIRRLTDVPVKKN